MRNISSWNVMRTTQTVRLCSKGLGRTSKGYDLERWRHDPFWMLDALIGRNVGNEADRWIISNEVGQFLMKA